MKSIDGRLSEFQVHNLKKKLVEYKRTGDIKDPVTVISSKDKNTCGNALVCTSNQDFCIGIGTIDSLVVTMIDWYVVVHQGAGHGWHFLKLYLLLHGSKFSMIL